MAWHDQGRTADTAEVHLAEGQAQAGDQIAVGRTGPQLGDAGIDADGQEYIREPHGWVPVPEPKAGG